MPLSVDVAAKVAGLFLFSRRVGAEFKRRCLFAVVPPDEQVGLEKIQKNKRLNSIVMVTKECTRKARKTNEPVLF